MNCVPLFCGWARPGRGFRFSGVAATPYDLLGEYGRMPEQVANPPTEARHTSRLEAFSDGVFAIAIMLLVLELKVPNLETAGSSPAALGKALLPQWPSYAGLVTSFFTILIM
jgi:Endosomal/lysosomal potassium channel TMEM175